MPLSRQPTLSRPQTRWRRSLLWTLGGLLVLEVLYNTVLATGLLATVINHFTHEHPRVEWRWAWSLVPGRVHVRDLKLRHENTSGTSWQLAMDEVKVDLSLLSLLKRTLRTDSLDVRGLSVQIRSGSEDTDKDKAPRPPPADPWKVFLHGAQVPLRLKAPWQLYSDVYTHQDGTDRLGMKITLGPVRMDGVEGLAMETQEVLLLLGAKPPRLDEHPPDARLELHAKQVQATWGGARLKGHVHVEADAQKISLQRGKMALHGSQVQLQEVSVRTGACSPPTTWASPARCPWEKRASR